jgi:hypothetical protein
MIDITKAKATTIEQTAFGHLLLCWINGACYRSIRVRGGVLCFDAPSSVGMEAAVRYMPPVTTVCLDVGVAAVCWCDQDVAQGRHRAVIGNVVVDQNGISIVGKDTDPQAFAQGTDVKAWRLEDGEPQYLSSVSLVIRNWEIGVHSEDGKFIEFKSVPRSG